MESNLDYLKECKMAWKKDCSKVAKMDGPSVTAWSVELEYKMEHRKEQLMG